MTDELMEDQADEDEDDPVAVSLRRARETLERTTMSDEEREAHEARARENRFAEIVAGQQRSVPSNYQTRRAPLPGEGEEQWEADLRRDGYEPPSESPLPA